MTAPFRLGVLMLQSPTEHAWRVALATAGQAQNAIVAKTLAGLRQQGGDGSVIFFVSNAAEAAAFDASSWVILSADLEVAVASVMEKAPNAPQKAFKLVAERLAAVGGLMDRGAIVLDSAAETLCFPGLGEVMRARAALGPAAVVDAGPLAIYRENPPQIGARASWAPEVFFFKKQAKPQATPSVIDLTGRGRVIVFGPRFDLPAGRWSVTTRLSIETEGSDIYLRFQWGVGEDFEMLEVMLQHSGVYEVVLDHGWSAPGPAELRVWASNAHFVGRMEFLGAEVERLPDLDREATFPHCGALPK